MTWAGEFKHLKDKDKRGDEHEILYVKAHSTVSDKQVIQYVGMVSRDEEEEKAVSVAGSPSPEHGPAPAPALSVGPCPCPRPLSRGPRDIRRSSCTVTGTPGGLECTGNIVQTCQGQLGSVWGWGHHRPRERAPEALTAATL